MALDLTSFQAALKTLYTDKKIENLVYKDNPLLALVPKMDRFVGENMKMPLIYGNSQARSAGFSAGQALVANASSKLKAFFLTRDQDYGFAQIDHETMKATETDPGAFLRAFQTEIDGILHSTSRSLATSLYRSGSGSIGQVNNSSFATPDLQLKEVEDVVNFEVGMRVVVSSTDGGGTVRTGQLDIIGIDRINGVLTMSGNLSAGIAAIAQNDYIFVIGDYDQKIKGLQAWLPYGGPSATPFFQVDRTADKTRLAGIWQDGSAKPIEEALIDLASLIAREGGNPDYCFMNYQDFANLEKALGSKVQIIIPTKNPEIGFQGIQINGPRGPIKVVPDMNCPPKYAYMLQLNTWQLASLGKAPTIFEADGLVSLRVSDADAVGVRVYYYAQLGCMAPGYNGVVKLRS